MYTKQRLTEYTELDDIIDELLDAIHGKDATSPEYAKMADQLTKLYKMKEIENNFNLKVNDSLNMQEEIDAKMKQNDVDCKLKEIDIATKQKQLESLRLGLSMETWAVIAANLAGIVLILGYERVNIVTSKALGFVSKLK